MRQILVKFAPRPSAVPSEMDTSLTNAAASQRVAGAGLGVLKVYVGKGLVAVAEGIAAVLIDWEAIACAVSAAAVYSWFNVAAACGVLFTMAGALQAKLAATSRIGKANSLLRVFIKFSLSHSISIFEDA